MSENIIQKIIDNTGDSMAVMINSNVDRAKVVLDKIIDGYSDDIRSELKKNINSKADYTKILGDKSEELVNGIVEKTMSVFIDICRRNLESLIDINGLEAIETDHDITDLINRKDQIVSTLSTCSEYSFSDIRSQILELNEEIGKY